jgi:hypothetical protein
MRREGSASSLQRAIDLFWPIRTKFIHRRTASIVKCTERGYEPSWTPTSVSPVSTEVHKGTSSPARSKTGHNRLGSGERPKRHFLGGKIYTRSGVRRPAIVRVGPENLVSNLD